MRQWAAPARSRSRSCISTLTMLRKRRGGILAAAGFQHFDAPEARCNEPATAPGVQLSLSNRIECAAVQQLAAGDWIRTRQHDAIASVRFGLKKSVVSRPYQRPHGISVTRVKGHSHRSRDVPKFPAARNYGDLSCRRKQTLCPIMRIVKRRSR